MVDPSQSQEEIKIKTETRISRGLLCTVSVSKDSKSFVYIENPPCDTSDKSYLAFTTANNTTRTFFYYWNIVMEPLPGGLVISKCFSPEND